MAREKTSDEFDGQKLKRILDHQGRTHRWLRDWLAAMDYDLDESYVSLILDGKRRMPIRFADLSAKAVGVPVSFLRADEAEPAHAD